MVILNGISIAPMKVWERGFIFGSWIWWLTKRTDFEQVWRMWMEQVVSLRGSLVEEEEE